MHSADDLNDALVSMEVAFTTSLPTRNIFHAFAHAGPVPCAPTTSAPQARSIRNALEQSFKTGTSFDIIFQAYTRRLPPGKAARPSPIYACTTVLQATAPLPDFFEEGFNFSSLFELPEGGTPPFTSPESCEYESDSDLDDEEGDNMAAVRLAEKSVNDDVASESVSHDQQSHSPVLHDTRAQGDATDNGSILSLSSFEAFQEQSTTQTSLLEQAEMVTIQNMKSGSRVVLVKGVAWKTWHAFVYYCYTGIINFSGLRSQAGTEAKQSPLKDGLPHCSPKSMYQLAQKLNNDALSQLAFKAIETRLSAVNILDEVFSKFAARHEAVRAMELALLVKHGSESGVLRVLPTKMEAVANGSMPHTGPVLTALYQRIAQTNSVGPANQLACVTRRKVL